MIEWVLDRLIEWLNECSIDWLIDWMSEWVVDRLIDWLIVAAGAGKLVNDTSVYPIRGQVLRVAAPWIKQFYYGEDNIYIIPNRDSVVVGGTRQKDNWSREINDDDRERFLEKNYKIMPSLKVYFFDNFITP